MANNNNIDTYIETLEKGSEVQFNWVIHIIQKCDSYDVELLEKGEINSEELVNVTWSEIAEEIEFWRLEDKIQNQVDMAIEIIK